MLTTLHEFDDALLNLNADQLYQQLDGPSLFHLTGQNTAPLFLSVLLHGNENTGWEVVKNIVARYKDQGLPRSLSVFVGNIEAARYKKRKLDTQPDFNRVWIAGDNAENTMMQEVVDAMQKRQVFASIDIHNNNGLNPHYACINKLTPAFLELARAFSRMVIYFVRPRGVQSLAFAELCPSVTLECGQPGDEYGIQLATNYVDNILKLEQLDATPDIDSTIDLYHTIGVIKVPDKLSISFTDEAADIQFINGIERLNFEEIPAGTSLAKLNSNLDKPLNVIDEDGNDMLVRLFNINDNKLENRVSLIPAMLTTNIEIIRNDCLCYLMERYDIKRGEKPITNPTSVWQ